MNRRPTLNGSLRELAYRARDGIEVTLLWNARDDRVTVAVLDARTGSFFEVEADRDQALDAFYHPYAHAAGHGVLYTDAFAV
jgi:hypothetical protein